MGDRAIELLARAAIDPAVMAELLRAQEEGPEGPGASGAGAGGEVVEGPGRGNLPDPGEVEEARRRLLREVVDPGRSPRLGGDDAWPFAFYCGLVICSKPPCPKVS
jgi:hypothetical protein